LFLDGRRIGHAETRDVLTDNIVCRLGTVRACDVGGEVRWHGMANKVDDFLDTKSPHDVLSVRECLGDAIGVAVFQTYHFPHSRICLLHRLNDGIGRIPDGKLCAAAGGDGCDYGRKRSIAAGSSRTDVGQPVVDGLNNRCVPRPSKQGY